ncbi:hypothetical protein DPMN_113752 [Dreissena polymorpha]|uniref:Uncharacterized protein n=1 Tax=Dreissena polymorpha TaxID=45954 RepID=A0A9D4KHZ0_DREPO|nr:hypothetical protein DPMN_113752 [Dreissena polymorpha]
MSSSNPKVEKGLPLMEMEVWLTWGLTCIIFSMKLIRIMGKNRQPRRTPTYVMRKSPI